MTPDEKYMQRALQLAAKGGRAVAPNPMVGAVVVRHGKIIGEGCHRKFGGLHAEINAIHSVKNKKNLIGAALYVTLEPCRHHGKTPPCMDMIRSVGIKTIVCGSSDLFQKKFKTQNSKFKTQNSKLKIQNSKLKTQNSKLKTQNSKLKTQNSKLKIQNSKLKMCFLEGPVADQCKRLNKFYFTWISKKRPFITVKIAITADGFVAGPGGQSIRITDRRQDVQTHQLRAQHQAIMIGSNTVLADDPHLGVRLVKGKDPLRIVLDSKNRAPKTARVFRDNNIMRITRRMPLKQLFTRLALEGISSVLVEPGPTLYRLLKKADLIDELIVFKGKRRIKKGLSIDL